MKRIVPSSGVLRRLAVLCNDSNSSAWVSGARRANRHLVSPTRESLHSPCTSSPVRRPQAKSFSNATSPLQAGASDATASPLPDVSSYYSLFPRTLAGGPPPNGSFDIDTGSLKREFLQLQAQYHPDKYSQSSARHRADVLSAYINEAYKTLADPLLRAQYLLQKNYDIDVMSEDSNENPMDQETLMAVMEAQETIEEAQSDDDIEPMRLENGERMRETIEELGTALESDDVEAARVACVRLKYWRTIAEGLHDWEPGKEVRLVH